MCYNSAQLQVDVKSMKLLRSKIILYPFLFALYPTLFLYSHNIKQVPLYQIVLPMIFSLLLSLIIWFILSRFMVNQDKRGFLLLIFLVLFFLYSDIFGLFYYIILGFNLPVIKDYQFILFLFLIWLLLINMVGKSRRSFTTMTRILNIAVLFLVVFNLFNIVIFHSKHLNKSIKLGKNHQISKNSNLHGDLIKSLPDIYYIIFDEMASLSTIKSIFDYNNDFFGQKMEKKGFFIATDSRTRFRETEKSLATSLNMNYFKGGDPFDATRKNRVTTILKEYGYSIINIVHWKHTAFTLCDRIFHFSPGKYSLILVDYYQMLMEKTPLRFLRQYFIKKDIFQLAHRQKVLYSLEKLESISALKGPKFVFAHVVCPHDPFVFNRQGGPVKAENFFNISDIYICKRIEDIVDAILSQSTIDPIIIIQSDHGPRGESRGKKDLQMGAEWASIFNAIYLPRILPANIPFSLSPANTFRLIFNLYFQQKYQYLPN